MNENERAMIADLAEWIATAPRDMVLIMFGMMLRDTRKVE